ncbi:hypothetical protein LWI29_013348 [Acer saccharum]|uniref:C-JID domain-containing protein n=1 Tax=Acer saccharum TaxID=4024 RepID=A0AA39W1M7_ACESA|nr:hypothetical protein LWI29_013348 [Acer saccharum]
MQLSPQAFKKMYNLRFFKFYDSGIDLYFDSPYNSKVHFPNGLSDLSGKLRSLIWYGFPLTALPSNFSPENLVELHLRDSNLEKLWEDTMHAPNLKWLILYGCKRLTNIPDLSNAPLLEMIDLKHCRRLLDFPPLAQHLKYLHSLDLCGCKSLRSFPDFPCSLTNLYLSDCNLKEIPEDICHLSFLEDLDLSGNDFESLPKSMKQLSILKNLSVNNCNMLQSLTELPLSIEFLSASDCKQLRSIPDASELVEAIFIFTNCPNLEETAVGNILATVEGYEGELDQFSLCCPGSEVPGWFNYKSNESSIEFRMAWHDCFNGQVLGFIVCAVTEFEEYRFDANDGVGLVVECRWKCSDGDESYPLFWSGRCILVAAPSIGTLIDSDHVAFGYCKAFDHRVLKSEFTNCSFKFQLSKKCPNCRVKSCGVWPITLPNEDDKVQYAEPIKIFGVTNEDIGETIGKRSCTSNDHQKEEVEPHSKRINLDLSL